jgi:hypothetical protein
MTGRWLPGRMSNYPPHLFLKVRFPQVELLQKVLEFSPESKTRRQR